MRGDEQREGGDCRWGGGEGTTFPYVMFQVLWITQSQRDSSERSGGRDVGSPEGPVEILFGSHGEKDVRVGGERVCRKAGGQRTFGKRPDCDETNTAVHRPRCAHITLSSV